MQNQVNARDAGDTAFDEKEDSDSVGAIVQMRLIARGLPIPVFVCTEGFLLARPQKVDVTRWNEVIGFQRVLATRKKKYRLNRINRNPLFFGEALEDVEGLADLIRRQSKLFSC